MAKAYSFFDLRVSKEELERELPNIRELAKIPSNLEILLTEVKDLKENKVDPDLLSFIRENGVHATFPSKYKHLMATSKPTKMANLRYILEANNHNGTVEDAGEELSYVTNQIYSRYGNGEPFTVAILGKIDGQYLIHE